MKPDGKARGEPSVLVGAPVYYGCEDYLERLISSWQGFTYENTRFCLVENNVRSEVLHDRLANTEFVRKPGDLFVFTLDNGHLDGWEPLTQAQNQIRQVCLQKGFDFLLMNEASRPAPSDIVEKLLCHEKKIIGTLYRCSWHPGYYCVYDFDYEKYTHAMERYRDIDQITEPTRVYGIGFGVILIHTSILAITEFRSGRYAADTYFYEELYRRGIPVYAAPITVENLRIESDPALLRDWEQARQQMQKDANSISN